ncbi:hypothetical protein ACE2AJ_20615 [Aquihabitans daechungensis]|uniref:hypothetical protein n=1 Tax=Aquihabitans daechungensis TaxID=1052257 RepID=UPI003BA188B5
MKATVVRVASVVAVVVATAVVGFTGTAGSQVAPAIVSIAGVDGTLTVTPGCNGTADTFELEQARFEFTRSGDLQPDLAITLSWAGSIPRDVYNGPNATAFASSNPSSNWCT